MMDRRKINLALVRALKPGSIIWDSAVPGFGARRQRDSVSYVLKYRTLEGRQRWLTIGRHGAPWTPDMARTKALKLLGQVVEGVDPATEKQARRSAFTIAELCRRYLADAEAGRILAPGGQAKKPKTLDGDRGRITGHIIPLLGRLPVAAVTRQDVERFMHAVAEGATTKVIKTRPRGLSRVRGGKGAANRTIELLGGIFSYAVDRQIRVDNPVHRVRKFAGNPRERRLGDDEYALLGAGLRQLEHSMWPSAIAATRLLALAGWRSGEALALRWRDVDLERRTATLPNTKSGRSMRPLSRAACELLRSQPRLGDDKLIFPATRGDGLLVGFKKMFCRIVAQSGLLADVSPHVLRHSFASLAADLGYSEPTIAALVGHKGRSITSRYIHSADAVLLAAADAVATEIARRMSDTRQADVVPLQVAR